MPSMYWRPVEPATSFGVVRPAQVAAALGDVDVQRVRAALVQGALGRALRARLHRHVEPGLVGGAVDVAQHEVEVRVRAAAHAVEGLVEHGHLLLDLRVRHVAVGERRALVDHVHVDRHRGREALGHRSAWRPSISASVDITGSRWRSAARRRCEAPCSPRTPRSRAPCPASPSCTPQGRRRCGRAARPERSPPPPRRQPRRRPAPATSLRPLVMWSLPGLVLRAKLARDPRSGIGSLSCWRSAASSTPRGRRHGCGGRSRRSCRRCGGCWTSPASRSWSSIPRTPTSTPPRPGSPPTPSAPRSCPCSTGPTSPSAAASPRPRWRPAARSGSSAWRTGRARRRCTTASTSAWTRRPPPGCGTGTAARRSSPARCAPVTGASSACWRSPARSPSRPSAPRTCGSRRCWPTSPRSRSSARSCSTPRSRSGGPRGRSARRSTPARSRPRCSSRSASRPARPMPRSSARTRPGGCAAAPSRR